MRRKPTKKNDKPHYCKECAHLAIVTEFHTLSVEGKPTLGLCPFVTNRKVLLSEDACPKFKPQMWQS